MEEAVFGTVLDLAVRF